MADDEFDDLVALVTPLLRSMAALEFIQRYFNPQDLARVLDAVGEPEAPLADALTRMEAWPDRLAQVRTCIGEAARHVVQGFEGLRAAPGNPDGMRLAFRGLGQLARAQEAVFPLAANLPPVSRYFLSPEARADAAKTVALAEAPPADNTGVFHVGDAPGAKGGFSLYVPEDYLPDVPAPLVMALHGGSGNGRSFLWSWLREARSRGAILCAPTAIGDTWALMGPDSDSPNLAAIVDKIRSAWAVDESRMLMTGMSDGGTFGYVSGLVAGSPFTHLAPSGASFHPILAQMADKARITGLPIHITHGALDWMFHIDMAREAAEALAAAGASVTYREIDDLAHTYPREVNTPVLDWMDATAR